MNAYSDPDSDPSDLRAAYDLAHDPTPETPEHERLAPRRAQTSRGNRPHHEAPRLANAASPASPPSAVDESNTP